MSEIIAYGSGEMLRCVFDSIAMLMGTDSGHFYRPLFYIGGFVGATWAISKALWDSSIQGLILHWMIPMVVLVGVCIIPTMSVDINDVLRPLEHKRVDNVPLGLARAAQTISTIGHCLTKAVEIAFHTPEHSLYNKTGMIFGAENLLEMNRFAITDEHLADTLRDFVHNCVTYDLAMELYSINDIKTAPDIWALIAQNTSKIRMFSVCTEKTAASATGETAPHHKKDRCTLKPCNEGVKDLAKLLTAYKDKFKTSHIFEHMPQFYQQLTGMAQEAQQLISQQIMMHSIIDAVERKCESSGIGTNFAIRRAYLQQRNNV